FEAKAEWWVRSREYFDGRINEAPPIPTPVKIPSRSDVPKYVDPRYNELINSIKELQKKNDAHKKLLKEVYKFYLGQSKPKPVEVREHYGLSNFDFSVLQNTKGLRQDGPKTFTKQDNSSFFDMAQRTPMYPKTFKEPIPSRHPTSHPSTSQIATPMALQGFSPWSSTNQARPSVIPDTPYIVTPMSQQGFPMWSSTNQAGPSQNHNVDVVNPDEMPREVSETIFGDNSSSPNNNSDEMGKKHFEDPFKIYDILKKQTGGETREEVYQEINRDPVDPNVVKEGGSVLGVLEDMIRVSQAMSEAVGNSGGILCRWNGETIILGDFNEVRSIDERRGSCFNPSSARVFDHFISTSSLVDVKLDGYTFTWSHPSGFKMSKLDRFLVSEGIFFDLYSITALCLDRHLLDHRPILLRVVYSDFGLIPFRMIRFKKKLQDLKTIIRCWIKDKRMHRSGEKNSIKNKLSDIDKEVDREVVYDTNLFRHLELQCKLHDINQMEAKDSFQKSKIKWAIEGDENSKFFHGIINKKRSQLAIRGVFDHGLWCTDPGKVKETGLFSKGCNSSFVALFQKVADAKFVNNFRPISLIGSVYKVIMKILANRLALVIADLVSDTQSAFVANRQILDGPFILNEILHWCKRKKKQAMFFKVEFAKAYDSVCWDYLLDVLEAFEFGHTWCKWIRGTFSSARASVLVNGSPSNEFSFHCGLKQGDPLSPYLFILIMESLHISFSRAVDEGLFKGVHLQGSISISHLFYVDDAMFIGEWSDANLKGIVNILQFFFLRQG
nr:RNA-directed DNA polymerase, eukaryota [Tanacetum cinerariifolium]